MNPRDRVVVVTGASSGVGRALAPELAQRGAHVALAARFLLQRAESLAQRLGPVAQRALPALGGSFSILVLAAGTGPEGPGPLVSFLASKAMAKLRVPVTIVPTGVPPA